MLTFRQKLDKMISDDLLLYNQMKQEMSSAFLDFIQENCSIFIQSTDFKYIIIPQYLQQEFNPHVAQETQPIYKDDKYNHYIDPIMKDPFLYFCKIHNALSLYETIKSHPLLIPPETIMGKTIPPHLFKLVMNCVDPYQIHQLLPTTTRHDAVYITQIILKHFKKFPILFIHNISISNWLVQQGCSLFMLEQLKIPLTFPIQILLPNMTLSIIDKDIVEWCFKETTRYPFDMPVDNIIMNPFYKDCDHFHYVYYSMRHGHFPSNTGFSILLKKTNLHNKDQFFMDHVIQRLKTDHFDIELWTEVGWQENQDNVIELVMDYCNYDIQKIMVIHLFMNMMDIIYADLDYWVLKLINKFSLFMKFIHLVRFKTDKCENIRHVDKRIVDHVHNPTITQPKSRTYPPFYKYHPQKIVFYTPLYEKKVIPVYLDYIKSGLIQRILNPNGFKQTNKDKNTIELHIPDIFRNQEKILWDWVMYSYLQQIPPQCSVEDVVELYHLSQYLMDDQCEKQTLEWMDNQYMKEFEDHHLHVQEECLTCLFWNRSFG